MPLTFAGFKVVSFTTFFACFLSFVVIVCLCLKARNSLLQDGTILAWRFNAVTNCFEPAASLNGHTRTVVTLVVGANRLYSGSMDNSIRVSWFSVMLNMHPSAV